MTRLKPFTDGQRLFTYKVACDKGSAPNPYHGMCTLAICKPKIRSIAKRGDVIVGFGCKDDQDKNEEFRIVYCMVVDKCIPWSEYINLCKTDPLFQKKVPKNNKDQGDCIWTDADNFKQARPSWSEHDGAEDFRRDICIGKNVLIGETYWYFGKGDKDKYKIILPDDDEMKYRSVVPYGQGHRSNANKNFQDEFVKYFNKELKDRRINQTGILGHMRQLKP